MPNKLKYEYIKEIIELEGYKLITEKYVNAHQKLRYKCPKGHEGSVTWNNWKHNRRCPICFREKLAIFRRLNIEYVRESFEKEGYQFLAEKYIDAHQKLRYICPNGHRHNISWNSWQQGHRCLFCAGQGKPTIEFVRSEFEKESYILLATEYINSSQKLEYICPKEHRHFIDWRHWKNRKHRCPICYRLKIRASGHWNWKGGITPENVSLRFSDQYVWWRKAIFERDGYVCQICNKKGGSLHAHHIFRFGIFRLRRYKIWNGITLCEKCHKAIKGKENKFMPKFLFLNLKKCKNSKCYKL